MPRMPGIALSDESHRSVPCGNNRSDVCFVDDACRARLEFLRDRFFSNLRGYRSSEPVYSRPGVIDARYALSVAIRRIATHVGSANRAEQLESWPVSLRDTELGNEHGSRESSWGNGVTTV